MTSLKKRILFVDDEPAILAGLQNLLYKDRKRWEMVFALGGQRALEYLRTQTFDVVVSDMRMPGMDGAALLHQVRAESPATVRIMLSGHADREAIVRALPAVHQLLSKPCDAGTLRATIERSLSCGVHSNDATLRAVIGRLDKLPTAPGVYQDLAQVMESPTATVRELAAIVERDPGLSAKVLQLVNSAYFGVGQPTSSIEAAVRLLGTEQLRYIALTASVFSSTDSDPVPDLLVHELQKGSARTACLVRELLTGPEREVGFAAALLHDVGSIVLATGLPVEYRRVLELARGGHSHITVELEQLGATHAEVGASLLAIWGVPELIVDVVRHHHDPGAAAPSSQQIAAAVHVADAVVHARDGVEVLDHASLDRAGATHLLPSWLAIARSHA